MSFRDFAGGYIDHLYAVLKSIDLDELGRMEALVDRMDRNNNIYIAGNGGSAATASHMANDFGIGLKKNRDMVYSVESLSDNAAVCSAIANDTGFENIFYLQLKDRLNPGDVLVAISCSGNSPNIVKVAEYAKEVGAQVVALTGFDGGRLKALADIKVHVDTQKGEYGIVEDVHMVINHLLYTWFLTRGDDGA